MYISILYFLHSVNINTLLKQINKDNLSIDPQIAR
ncbi:hypothetical protein CAL7102_02124 [Dulcicalothrix desertica PCC 7102]|nr:hypothetical protein CAL7102_02124 [Dulcicalothrix desertica PCC 7102]